MNLNLSTLGSISQSKRVLRLEVRTLHFEYTLERPIILSYLENGQGIVVSWTTWNDTGKSLVEFGTHVSELDQTAIGVSRIFVDGGLEARRQFIHTVKLEQLHPNTIYRKKRHFLKGFSNIRLFLLSLSCGQ